jgi:hypothetical protein
VSGAELKKNGGLAAVEVFDELKEFLGWGRVVDCF